MWLFTILLLHQNPQFQIKNDRIYYHITGYVSRTNNEAISNQMDAGKTVFGIIYKKEWSGDYLDLGISIYLKELYKLPGIRMITEWCPDMP